MKQWIEKHSIGITLAIVVAIMVIIFCFSAQTGEESGAMSGRITTWVVSLLVPNFESLPETERELLCSRVGFIIRKGAHFSEYALLGFFLMLHIQQIRKRVTVRRFWLWSWVVGTLYAASDELHQGFVAGRGPSVTDVMIDSSGVIVGTILLLLIVWYRQNRRTPNKLTKRKKKAVFLRKKS